MKEGIYHRMVYESLPTPTKQVIGIEDFSKLAKNREEFQYLQETILCILILTLTGVSSGLISKNLVEQINTSDLTENILLMIQTIASGAFCAGSTVFALAGIKVMSMELIQIREITREEAFKIQNPTLFCCQNCKYFDDTNEYLKCAANPCEVKTDYVKTECTDFEFKTQ